MIKTCEGCKKDYEAKKINRRFCSSACYRQNIHLALRRREYVNYSPYVEKTCTQCHQVFSTRNKTSHCSMKCYQKSYRLTYDDTKRREKRRLWVIESIAIERQEARIKKANERWLKS